MEFLEVCAQVPDYCGSWMEFLEVRAQMPAVI
jgi:hypothetical protein